MSFFWWHWLPARQWMWSRSWLKKRIELTTLDITATGEQDTEAPWTFRKIHLLYRVGGKGLTEKAVEQAIQLSEEKYCSVASTIRGVAEITTSFELLPEK